MGKACGLRIGIMGGTFNPVHVGHLLLAETALSEENLDHVMFIPSGCPYLKQDTDVLDAVHRLRMVELAIGNHPSFSVSDMEIRRGGNTYTCDTLRQLQAEHREDTFYFIMGADCLFSIENWKNPQDIFDRCILLAAVRDGAEQSLMAKKCAELEERFHARIKLLPFPETAISSTMIRDRVFNEKSIRYMVPESVRDYIEGNHLYR